MSVFTSISIGGLFVAAAVFCPTLQADAESPVEDRLIVGPIHAQSPPEPSIGSQAPTKPRSTGEPTPEASASAVPETGGTIEGINFDEDGTNSGFYHIPPDPIGAVGPAHVVSVVNTSIEWHTKSGIQENSQKLGPVPGGFFDALNPVNNTFDPKVIYDAHAGRFVVVTLERIDTGLPSPNPVNTSRILVAVSDDDDPNGAWHYLAINSKTVVVGIERWADYPGLAVDEDAIYIAANLFAFQGNGNANAGVRLWIVHKAPLYAGGAGVFTAHNPYASGGLDVTTQPATILGTPPAGSTGTFLVSYSGLSDGTSEYLQIARVDNPVTSPTFVGPQFINIGNLETGTSFPDAPQSGTGVRIETNDRRTLNAVWRNNRLWTTAEIVPSSGPDAEQVTAHWWELDTTAPGAVALVQQGDVGGEEVAAGAFTFFPALTVDPFNNMAIGFSISAPTIFPSAGYTGRLATDAAGTTRPVFVYAQGQDYYIRTFGGTRNRWGDYSGIGLDPAEESTFWVFNVYALTRGTVLSGEDGRWGTRWGAFSFVPELPEIVSFSLVGDDFQLSFTTVPNQTYSVERSLTLIDGSWVEIASDIAGTGSDEMATDIDAALLDEAFYRVRAAFPTP